MQSSVDQLGTSAGWPPVVGELVRFNTNSGVQTGLLLEVRWGLVWRDFVLADGRVLPEHRILGAPNAPVWRDPHDVSKEEQQACEEQLVGMAEGGLDPNDRESAFWAALNQYLAYTYLRFQRTSDPTGQENPRL